MSSVVDHLAELTGCRDRDVLDTSLVGALRDLLAPQSVAIFRAVGEAAQPQRWLTRARLAPGDSAPTADSVWADLAQLPLLESQPLRLACLRSQQTVSVPAGREGGAALTFFALAGEPEAIGVLELATAQPLDAQALRLVSSILRIYRNFQGLLDYSERDTLTGLLNRKTFDESFMRIAAQEALTGQPGTLDEPRRGPPRGSSWLGVIDIDHFKRVNDTYGHLIGDEVLLLLSRLMRSNFRFHDHLYRFGGEEFVVLMRCGSAADAASAMERLRGNVARYAFPQVGHITVSIGFTELRSDDTPSAAFDRADKAVYHAKQHGRNQVAHHAALVASGQLAEDSHDGDVELF